MHNWTGIRVKVGSGFVLLTVLIFITSLLSYQALTQLSANNDHFASQMLPAQQLVLNGDRDLYQAQDAIQKALLQTDKTAWPKLRADFNENSQQAWDRMQQFLALMQAYPQVTTHFSGFETAFNRWKGPAAAVFEQLEQTPAANLLSAQQDQQPLFNELREYYNQASDLVEQLAVSLHQDSQSISQQQQRVTLILALISLLTSLVLTYFSPALIVNAVAAVRNKIDDINQGAGDLVSRLPINSRDELGELCHSVNRLLDQLQHLVTDVIGDVKRLGQRSQAMNATVYQATDIRDRQQNQLNSLVTAFTEIGHAIQSISQHAQATSAKSNETQSSATQGMTLLEQNIELSNRLAASIQNAGQMVNQLASESERITSVLDVIRGIADQTNLLALNAAIEAARAGEHGRGFAVVADEVRSLAGRTQHSTEDIQKMIASLKQQVANAVSAMDSGFEQMQGSVQMANQMRGAFSSIQGLVAEVQDMNFQVASATEEQSLVMHEVNQRFSELHSLTDEAAQVSAAVSDSGRELDTLASQLAGRVSQFRV